MHRMQRKPDHRPHPHSCIPHFPTDVTTADRRPIVARRPREAGIVPSLHPPNMASAAFHPFRITAVRELNACVRLVRAEQVLADPGGSRLRFRPGQWADVALGAAEAQARRQRQPAAASVGVGGYSFISAPESLPTVEFAIQREAERGDAGDAPAVTSMTRWIHSGDCREGVELQLRAGGRFVLQPVRAGEAPEKLMLVAAGIGITPFLSFLRSSVNAEPASSAGALLSHVSLLYSVRGVSERGVFVEELEELHHQHGLHLRLFDTAIAGRISRETLAEARESSKIYLCGPPDFSAGLERVLVQELSVPRERVHYENWWDPPQH